MDYGFVYLWYDRKHKRYYVGCHWGSEDDGYICSSKWMKDSYKRRPDDFKRRVLSRVYTNKKDLLEEEFRWLSMIKKEELHHRYYNLHNHHFNHWSTDEVSKLSVGEKISAAPNRAENISKALKGKYVGEDHSSFGVTRSEETRQKMRDNHTRPHLGKTASDETRQKMSLAAKDKPKAKEAVEKSANSRRGSKRTLEQRKVLSDAHKGTKKPWAGGNNKGIKDSPEVREKKRKASLIREQKKREARELLSK